MRNKLFTTVISLAFLNACSKPSETSKLDADAIGRNIIGPALPAPQTISDKSPEEIISSLSLTREKAWKIFAQLITEETIRVSLPSGDVKEGQIPRFMSWYSPEDANRLFAFGIDGLSPEAKDAGLPLTDEQWLESQAKLQDEIKTLPSPVQKKWAKFFETNPELSSEALMGASGLSRVLFNADLVGAAAKNYKDLQDCYPEEVKPAYNVAYKPCFPKGLPASSIMMKTNWLNTEAGFRKYATDAETLASVMSRDDASWDDLKQTADIPANIVKATLNGKTFVLGGMHIVSKEFEDWIWISAWWSENPNSDFGEDRPEEIQKLGAPWNQYKICAVSNYVQDAAELETIAKTYPSLAAAYKSVLDESGASWCSNPYIERGVNNQKTNCIGCHQYAGTDITQAEIIADASRFPDFGKLKQREDFPSDYIWSSTQGQISWLATFNSLRLPVH